jgi:4-hydroxy-4-methyl-2-oxoglutarate aldolase
MSPAYSLTINQHPPCPSAAILSRFDGVPTGHAVDAQGRIGAMDHGIKPVFEIGSVAGPALTVKSTPRDNLAPYAALAFARPGDIMVIATGDHTATAVVGDILVGMAANAGIRAIVTDGMVRDLEGLRGVGIPIIARGLTPNSPPGKSGPGSLGETISVGGQVVHAGDIIVCDNDGVVVVPLAVAVDVAEALDGIRKKEAKAEQVVAAGASRPDWLDAVLASEGITYLAGSETPS